MIGMCLPHFRQKINKQQRKKTKERKGSKHCRTVQICVGYNVTKDDKNSTLMFFCVSNFAGSVFCMSVLVQLLQATEASVFAF